MRARLLRRLPDQLKLLGRDSAYTAVWSYGTKLADLAQIALVTHALGIEAYGRLALIVAVVAFAGQFFNLRVGVATTAIGARRLASGVAHAAPTFQLGYMISAGAGILAFAVVATFALTAGPALVGEDGTQLILLYSLTLLVSVAEETSITILRLLDRFREIAAASVAVQLLRIGLLVVALSLIGSLAAVLATLVIVSAIGSAVMLILAANCFRRSSETCLSEVNIATVWREREDMLPTVFHTNVVSYARLVDTQVPTLILGALSTTTGVAFYKLGMAAASSLGMLANPLYMAFLPRLSNLWNEGRIAEARRLVQHSMLISGPLALGALAIVVALHDPILAVLGGSGVGAEAGTVLVIGALAHAINGALFWNVGVLFGSGQAGVVSRAAVFSVGFQLALLLALIPALGAIGAALTLLASYTILNAWLTIAALKRLREPRPEDRPVSEGPDQLRPEAYSDLV